MKKIFKKLFKGQELMNEAPAFTKGMSIFNSNGEVDVASLGFDYAIRTTTLLRQKSVKQKFYEVAIADFFTVEIGQGAWMETITQNLQFDSAGDFEQGIVNVNSGHSEVEEVESGVTPKTFHIFSWTKGYKYNIMEVEKALEADNWDKVAGQTAALKKNWDLGVQRIGFLGSKFNSNILGLLTQTEVTLDTLILDKNISDLAADEFIAFAKALLSAYFENSNYTQRQPNKLVMPMDDYLGLGIPLSSAFPLGDNRLDYLLKTFRQLTNNPKFEIIPLVYCQKAVNVGAVCTAGSQRYCLYNDDVEVVKMDIPVDFTLTNPNTADNFSWQGKAYGQATGVQVTRPAEMYYFEHHNS